MTPKKTQKQIRLEVDETVHTAVKMLAAQQHKTVIQFVRDAIAQAIKEKK